MPAAEGGGYALGLGGAFNPMAGKLLFCHANEDLGLLQKLRLPGRWGAQGYLLHAHVAFWPCKLGSLFAGRQMKA